MFWALDYFLPKRLDPTLANFVKAGEAMQLQIVTELWQILLCFVWSMCANPLTCMQPACVAQPLLVICDFGFVGN